MVLSFPFPLESIIPIGEMIILMECGDLLDERKGKTNMTFDIPILSFAFLHIMTYSCHMFLERT
jgi:hypothetical protein